MANQKKRRKRKLKKWVVCAIWFLIAALVLAVLWAVLAGKKKKVFTIGNETVYTDELAFYALQYAMNYHISNVDMLYEMYDGTTSYEEYYKEQLKQYIIDTKVMYICANQHGVTLTDDERTEIDAQVTSTITTLADYLEQYEVEDKLVKRVLTEQYLANKLKTQTFKSEEEGRKFFHTYNLLFSTVDTNADGTMKLNEDGSIRMVNAATKEQKYALAMKALELSRTGKSLEDIAEEMSTDVTASDIYGDIENYDSKVYLDAVLSMQDGDISGVVETVYGYNVFQLISADDQEYAATQMQQEQTIYASEQYTEQMEIWCLEAELDSSRLIGKGWENFTMKEYVVKQLESKQ